MTATLKQVLESHPVVVYSSAVVFAFGSGWGAHWAVQSTSGQTVVSSDRLKQLELAEKERDELKARASQPDRISENLGKNRKPAQSGSSRIGPTSISSENPNKSPNSKDKPWITLGKMYLEGFSGPFELGHRFTVSFDYFVEPGSSVNVWVHPVVKDGQKFYFQPSAEIAGTGRFSRYFVVNSPGTIKEVVVIASRGSESIILKKIPITFTVE